MLADERAAVKWLRCGHAEHRCPASNDDLDTARAPFIGRGCRVSVEATNAVEHEGGFGMVRSILLRAAWSGVAVLAVAIPAAQLLAQTPAPTAPTAMNPWVNLAPFPTPSEEVLGATANDKLYVFAGLAPGWKPKAMVQEFDPASNSWAQKKPMPLPSHHVAFATLDNKIYAFGGFKLPDSGPPGWEPIANAWEYDPAADTWKELAPMPAKRGAAAAGVVNGKIYVVGGANSLPGVSENGIHPRRPHNILATVEEYDPATNTWQQRRSMLLARNHHVAGGVNNKVYA